MSQWKKEALEKLAREAENGTFDKYGSAMKTAVRDALAEFCRQDGEFAQAVVQGGSFADCMKAVAKNCGSCLSDLEAFKRAAGFYFPGAEVRFRMEIALGPAPEEKKSVVLDLSDFL